MDRRAFTTGSAALLLSGLAPLRAAEVETVRIGWLRAPNDITLGKSRGTIEQALATRGVRVEWAGPFAAAAPAIEALNAGSIDITAGSSTACITALSAGVPLVIFAYQKIAPAAEAILVKADAPIRTLADLAGRKVAVNRGGTGEYLLMQALARNNIPAEQVQRVYLSPSDSGPAFDRGHVDAWATWDPFVTIALNGYDARILADGSAIGSENAVTLMASRSFAEKKHALLLTLFETALADNDWALSNKDEAGAIWTRAMNLPVDLGPAVGANNAVPTIGVSDAHVAALGRMADWFVAQKIMPRRPDIAAGVVKMGS